MIYWRFIMSQMAAAVYDEVAVTVVGESQEHSTGFRAYASCAKKKGWKSLLKEDEDPSFAVLKSLQAGAMVDMVACHLHEHTTKPPASFTEASLIKELERRGIGRPSTYATILDTLMNREYVRPSGKKLVITELGIVVDDALAIVFPRVLDASFTAEMESQLDRVAAGEISWIRPVEDIYQEILTFQ